jgi:ABC-type glycerol-3-phosphate transport system substrate-binding protein
LNFLLISGENLIEIKNETSQTIWVGNLTAYSYREPVRYRSPGTVTIPDYINVNAADYVKKNSPHVSSISYSSPHITPYDPLNKKIGTITSSQAGNEVFYQIYVPQDGNYAVTFHCQTAIEDFSSFISVKVDGEFPFAEAASYPLAPSVNIWRNQTMKDAEGTPLLLSLSRGNHIFSIKTELSPVSRQVRSLRLLIDHLNQFAIEIRKVTGKDIDRNRTWHLTQYIPEVKDYLDAYDIIFRDIIHGLSQYSPKGIDSSVITPMVQALSYLEKLRKKPDELPMYIESLSGQDASVLQQAGVALDSLYTLGMEIDSIYIGRTTDLPREKGRIITVLADGMRKLWHSYTSDKYIVRNQSDALNIWYSSSYMQVDLLQKLIDTRFTPQSGIKVNVSVMPDVNKLIMARAAKTNPDMALGLGSWIPFDLAVRGALYDLSQFDDFWEFAGNFVPGSLSSYVLNEKVYAVPETITFNAVVYREDILGQLNIAPPNTWTDVTEMMAELQRFDMSFYMPIASGVGYKWYYQTSPLIYQNNGLLYHPNGLSAAINESNAVKALTFLGDLFTTYAIAEQVPVFFNSFRLGQTPVGIIEPETFILLNNGAPELLGQWSLAPYPGTPQEDGSISRWFITNGAGGSIVFENTNQAENCWKFLKWYLSEETQTNYAFSLYTNYRILHLSSNIKALRNLPIEDKDKRVILESVLWLRDVPRSPGQYLLERGLSDIWNTMVFNGTPAQVAIDKQVIEIQREFKKKMTEFGYLNNMGEQVKPYVVHEVDWIIEQIEKARPEGK